MALITKPPAWAYCTTNLTGTPSTTVGTNLTANANNADGAAVSAISAITHDVEFLMVGFNSFNQNAGNSSTLLDILVDPAGGTSWSALINDLLVGYSATAAATISAAGWYFFPIWIKSGSSIGVRARTALGSNITTGRVYIIAYGGNANPGSWWCGQSVQTIGVTDTASQGTSHTAGNTGAYSTWTNFGSTLSSRTGALQFYVHGTNTTATSNALSYFFEFGVGSTRIGPNFIRQLGTTEAGWCSPSGPIFCDLPAGTQLQVRGTCSGTAQALDVAAYAVS